MAHPEVGEVVVFRDFFAVGFRFPLDPLFAKILDLFNMHIHQLTLNSLVRVNLYFWLAKTCCFVPSPEVFAHIHRVHHHLKCIQFSDCSEFKAQYGCYNFTYRDFIFGPVVAYKNKSPVGWASYWFYHKVPCDIETGTYPLVM